ncbi:polyprenol monophosphomannose synthase [candidate division KSB1 bacterium]|nr:polyprenol monophosphomannose synthase [candidate division KSB1 bacterium]
MKTLVIIPTYNEKENVAKIIEKTLMTLESIDVLIVDDNSPDGTARIVKDIMQKEPRVLLIEREGKLGLGTAYIAGFKFAIERKYDYIFEMDADFSHDPGEIPNFLEKIKDYDLVLGSRYLHGVTVVNWPLRRLFLSYSANVYSRIITGLRIKDCTGGFKCFRREVLEAIDLDKVHSGGYAFQIEMSLKAWKKGFKIIEIPIIFIDRLEGQSKMSRKIVFEAVWMVWKLRILILFGRL